MLQGVIHIFMEFGPWSLAEYVSSPVEDKEVRETDTSNNVL